jgi:2-polyprenyl-3-methyl-5-hydroxy-6-metoxy-1,4-benzoquinol methylase
MDIYQDHNLKNNSNIIPWLDDSHPNFQRWKCGRDLSVQRGEFVLSILNNFSICKNLRVLDLGSGIGGTSKVFSQNNIVISYDLDFYRLKNQLEINNEYSLINGNVLNLSFKKNIFDIIILQDVIEHLPEINALPEILFDILKDDGIIFISTPNKFSFLNIISDPHWGLPIVSLLRRINIKKYFLSIFRKQELNRKDIAQLFSLNDIQKIFGDKFTLMLHTKLVIQKLIEGQKGILWSSFHLLLIKLILASRVDRLLMKISNDNFGFLNKYFTPTFYLTIKKTI